MEQGFAEADAVVEAEYTIPYFHQTYLEPNAATARLEPDGRITIWTAAQGAFNIRDDVAGALQIPHGRIRVVVTQVGGAFGAKNGVFVEPHAAMLAMRPQVLVLDEPTASLDPAGKGSVLEAVLRLRSEADMAILWVTQDMDQAVLIADRVAVLGQGRILLEGKPKEVFGQISELRGVEV